MTTNVDAAQFGQLGAFVILVVLFLKHLAAENLRRDESDKQLVEAIKTQTRSIDRNTAATDKLVRSSEATASASKETLQFMKNLNGSLRKAVEDHKK